ncbi:MAG: DUF1883 domain-containing protein [Erythrobacter sp.]
MKFTHYDIGQQSRGAVVEVTLTKGANVRLMDSTNFSNYKRGKRHRYTGGLAKKSPFRLTVPRSGRWHVTVDVAGLRNGTNSSIRIVPGPLPVASEAPLTSEPGLLRDPFDDRKDVDKTYDIFISHASEDKDDLARPLAHALRDSGLSVWYDEFELKIGDSLRRRIDHGLARSRFGIVVLSPRFLSKGWANYELDGIVTRSVDGQQVVLPIWHEITKQEVIDFSPSLADKVARNTASFTVKEIANEIAEFVLGEAD